MFLVLTCFDLLWQPLHWIWRYYLSLNLDWLHKNLFLFFSYHNHPHVPTAWQCSWAAIGVGGYLCGHNQLGSDLFHIFALMATYQLEFHVTSIFSKNQPILLVPSVTLPINSHFQKGRPFWRPQSCTTAVAPWRSKERLLVLDASKRHTAEEALRHPWLLSVNASAEKVGGCGDGGRLRVSD